MKQQLYKLILIIFLGWTVFLNAQEQKVGINTTDPKETLDINGNLRVQNISENHSDKILAIDNNNKLVYTKQKKDKYFIDIIRSAIQFVTVWRGKTNMGFSEPYQDGKSIPLIRGIVCKRRGMDVPFDKEVLLPPPSWRIEGYKPGHVIDSKKKLEYFSLLLETDDPLYPEEGNLNLSIPICEIHSEQIYQIKVR